MDSQEIKLQLAVLEPKPDFLSGLKYVFAGMDIVATVTGFDNADKCRAAIFEQTCNALLVDIFAVGSKTGIKLVEAVRNQTPLVPICLLGTSDQLTTMPGVDEQWRTRFGHYYKLALDQPFPALAAAAAGVARQLSLWALSRAASVRLRDVRGLLEQPAAADSSADSHQSKIREALALAQAALETPAPAAPLGAIIPGFGAGDLQSLVKGTLQDASSSLNRSATVHKMILVFGGLLVVAAFVVATVFKSWEAVTFGGLGLTGVVASLITNPLKSIAATARRLVQIQVAYVGFLNVLATLGEKAVGDAGVSPEAKSSAINEAIRNVCETLEKNCQ